MSYVDIGWPCGLVVLGGIALSLGTAPWSRKLVICVPMLLHGGRMAIGSVLIMYVKTGRSFLEIFPQASSLTTLPCLKESIDMSHRNSDSSFK